MTSQIRSRIEHSYAFFTLRLEGFQRDLMIIHVAYFFSGHPVLLTDVQPLYNAMLISMRDRMNLPSSNF